MTFFVRRTARDLKPGDRFIWNHRLYRLNWKQYPDRQWGSNLAGYYCKMRFTDTQTNESREFSFGAQTSFDVERKDTQRGRGTIFP